MSKIYVIDRKEREKYMKVILHDLEDAYTEILQTQCDTIISANGKYAPCQGCFGCWTKHPAECYLKDSLHTVCRQIGRADTLIIITRNCYGMYSPAIKNVLDRSIGVSTPFSTYRGKQMHHTLRYGRHQLLKVLVYGDMTVQEETTFAYMTERNAINFGYARAEFVRLDTLHALEGMEL